MPVMVYAGVAAGPPEEEDFEFEAEPEEEEGFADEEPDDEESRFVEVGKSSARVRGERARREMRAVNVSCIVTE